MKYRVIHESFNAAGHSRRFQSLHPDSVSGGCFCASLQNVCPPRVILLLTSESSSNINPDPSLFMQCVSLEDPSMGSDFSQHNWRCGMSRICMPFPISIKFISSQWHLCGFSECQNITISAVTAKLCLAWPEFLGIETEAQATTNTLHRSSRPEQCRCLTWRHLQPMLWDWM